MVYEGTIHNYDELVNTGYAVVDFYGTHCGPCKYLAPFYSDASNDYAMLRFIKVNADQQPELAERFHVDAVPTLLYYRDGQVFFTSLGGMDRSALDKKIARLLYGEE